MRLPINPPSDALGRIHALVGGRGRQYDVRFTGPFSLKSVVSGSAAWETPAGRFLLAPGSALLLNDGEEYLIQIDSLQPVETFCVFFARGFIEDAYRATSTGSAALLDQSDAPKIGFYERVRYDAPLIEALDEVRRSGTEASLYPLATAIVGLQARLSDRINRLPALRASTRQELHRRLGRATEYIHANLAHRLRLEDVASAACLSTFHFHRLFASLHGETPHRYITRKRLERARSLLRRTSRSIADVALDCGFESLGSFTTLFARRFGVPPGQFRKNREAPARFAL